MRAQANTECRSCERTIYAGEEVHIVLGGNAQCCSCYAGAEPCERRATARKFQGKAIVETDGTGFLVMLPDGTVRSALTVRSAEQIARHWFANNLAGAGIGIGEIEWRGCAPGGA